MTILSRNKYHGLLKTSGFLYIALFLLFFFSRLIHAFPYLVIQLIESAFRLYEHDALPFFIHKNMKKKTNNE
jgi:hypothetical protein